jgi:polysaccharide pyruvyl transferase CsaB
MSPKKRIAIAGAFGFYNTGDDAVLQSWLNELRVAEPNLDIVVLGGDAERIREQFEVEAVEWSNWERTLEVMQSVDLLLIAGGGLFHDYWAFRSNSFLMPPKTTGPIYYINLIYLARLFGKPCILSGVGVGPLTTETGRVYTRHAFEGATMFTLRDRGSAELLRQTGYSSELVITSDPVFRLPPSRVSTHQWPKWIGSDPARPIFGISVRNWSTGTDRESWMNELVLGLDRLLEQTGGTAVFLPFQVYPVNPYTDDVAVSREIRDRMKLRESAHVIDHYLEPDLAEAMIGSCDLVIGMRLHSTIMAFRRATPVVALAYDPKVTHAMAEANLLEFCLPLSSLNSEALMRAVEQCLQDRESITDRLRSTSRQRFEEGHRNIENVLEVLASNYAGVPSVEPPFQRWATTIVKEISRLESELVVTREERSKRELESERHLQAIAHLQNQIKASADRAQYPQHESPSPLAQLQRIDRELQQIKSYLRHPLSSAYRLLRLKVRSVGRRALSRIRARHNWRISQTSFEGIAEGRLNGKYVPSLNRVCIVTPSFFDMAGEVPYLGGAERYLYELVQVIRNLGYRTEIYQPAQGDWVRHFRDLTIHGLNTGGKIENLNRSFHARVAPPALTIYLGFFLAEPQCFQPSIGISHGIYWDSEYFHNSPERLRETIRGVTSCLANLSTVISVDTNTINWVRTVSWPLAQKLRYLPNFVDLSQFRPRSAEVERRSNEVVILYPRRLYKQRGFWLIAEVLPDILRRYPEAIFYFVGQAGEEGEREFMESAMREYPGRVRWETLAPDQMHTAYWAADISVIPTVHAEGTSLSCLEAMASGNAVIATDVGGLPNLIIPGHNGLLIKPEVDDLRDALETLIRDEGLRRRLAERAVDAARSFNLEDWKGKWSKVLQAHLPQQPHRETRKGKPPSLTVIIENAVSQRSSRDERVF